jgi:hypothetical protein
MTCDGIFDRLVLNLERISIGSGSILSSVELLPGITLANNSCESLFRFANSNVSFSGTQLKQNVPHDLFIFRMAAAALVLLPAFRMFVIGYGT